MEPHFIAFYAGISLSLVTIIFLFFYSIPLSILSLISTGCVLYYFMFSQGIINF